MNADINQMVTNHTISAEIIVEGKTKTRYWTIDSSAAAKAGEERLFDVLPANFLKVKWFVLKDVNFIVEMP